MSHSSESMKPGNAVRFAATRKEYPIPDRKNTEEFLLDRAEPRTLDPEIVPGPSALTNLSERTTEYVDDAINALYGNDQSPKKLEDFLKAYGITAKIKPSKDLGPVYAKIEDIARGFIGGGFKEQVTDAVSDISGDVTKQLSRNQHHHAPVSPPSQRLPQQAAAAAIKAAASVVAAAAPDSQQKSEVPVPGHKPKPVVPTRG